MSGDGRMRAIRYHEYGGPDALTLDEVDHPAPSDGELLVAVRAASVNPIDTYVRSGDVGSTALPRVAGSDLAGVVTDVGADVTEFEPGDRVYATCRGVVDEGTLAELAVVPAAVAAELPSAVSFAEGAAAAMTFATAWHGLVERGGLSLGDTCLVSGAAGGVGHAAVQVAREAGATTVALARSEQSEYLRGLGADAVVDYRTSDLGAALRDAVDGEIDVALESHAGANLAADVDAQRPALTAVAPLLADGRFEARVDAAYPLTDAVTAYERLASDGVRGSIVVRVGR